MRESIESKESFGEDQFARLCQDHPDLALLAIKTYDRKSLPVQLPKFTIGTLGYKAEHEDVLMKLVELNMCQEYPHLLHLACQCNYPRLVQMLIGRDASVHARDYLGNTPHFYANQNQVKFANSLDTDANIQRRQNELILEYLATAKK